MYLILASKHHQWRSRVSPYILSAHSEHGSHAGNRKSLSLCLTRPNLTISINRYCEQTPVSNFVCFSAIGQINSWCLTFLNVWRIFICKMCMRRECERRRAPQASMRTLCTTRAARRSRLARRLCSPSDLVRCVCVCVCACVCLHDDHDEIFDELYL